MSKNIHRNFIRPLSLISVIAASAALGYAAASSSALNGFASQGVAMIGGYASAHFSGNKGSLAYPSQVATSTGSYASAATSTPRASVKPSSKATVPAPAKSSNASAPAKAAASTTTSAGTASDTSAGSGIVASVAASNEKRFTAYTTGYGWPDNTPKGSAEISNPIVHTLAGGTGTFADPITLAVGHSIISGRDLLDYPAGTKFYIPNLRKYFIAEDTCGDGNTPQNGPCHTGYQGHVWLDLWVGGNSSNQKATLACEDDITDLHLVIENPASNYAVVPGDIASTCTNYGDTVATK